MITQTCPECGKQFQVGGSEYKIWCSVGCQYNEPTKHRKGGCVFFLEVGLPCEDCDLEGHAVMCDWHKDWHKCNCGVFDKEETK